MIALRRRTISAAVLTLALGVGVAGCSDDEDATGPVAPAVLGTWNATSFIVLGGGGDLIVAGMQLTFIFDSDGHYDFFITNDQGGLCDQGGANCSEAGEFTATAAQIILDPGTTDATTLNYSIAGTTMTITADIDEGSIVVVLAKG